jgi:hypothetical protein
MTLSPTAQMLAQAIDVSGLTQRHIADRVAFTLSRKIDKVQKGGRSRKSREVAMLTQLSVE